MIGERLFIVDSSWRTAAEMKKVFVRSRIGPVFTIFQPLITLILIISDPLKTKEDSIYRPWMLLREAVEKGSSESDLCVL